MLLGRGYETVTRVLSVERVPADDVECAELGLTERSEVIRLVRVREWSGEVILLSWNAFSAEILAEDPLNTSDFEGSLCDWLDLRGRRPVSSAAQIRACHVPDDLAKLSGIDSTQPWLVITERCLDHNETPVLFSRDYHRSDIFSFHFVRRSGC
jgi:GntR family transcriptional regulator